MYWIYLLIFTLVVFAPGIIGNGAGGLTEDATEELFILFLGIFASLIYISRERQLTKTSTERLRIQREVNELSKSLADSYLYIGETNRKVEVLKSILFKMIDVSAAHAKSRKEIAKLLADGVRILSKTERFSLFFIDTTRRKILYRREKLSGEKRINFDKKKLFCEEDAENKKGIIKGDDFVVICSTKNIRGVGVVAVFNSTNKNVIENLEMLQVLLAQSLLLFKIPIERRLTGGRK